MKLLRTAVEILHFSILTSIVYGNSNDTTVTVTATSHSFVWSIDGTLDYLGYPHILLFVAALFTLLFLWLPYIHSAFASYSVDTKGLSLQTSEVDDKIKVTG